MEHLNLDDIGLTDRTQYNATVANFAQIESVVNSNAMELEQLTKRITALEDMLFGKQPQEVKMAESSTPPKNGGSMLVNLTSKEDK